MQLNELLSKLRGVKQNGNQYIARCPASTHGKGNGDKNQSLSVGLKGNSILLKCHAGCPTESIVSALGFEMKDLFAEEKNMYSNSGNTKPKRDIVAVYDYKDLNGNIIHSTIRYNPKGFSQRRPDPQNPDKFIWKDVFKGITSIIYNLGPVTTAIKEKQPILVVEGEKDCVNLAKYGFVATTCPMGAGSWKNYHSIFLTNGTVYIIADNDEVGYKHYADVANSLVGKAEKIFLIDLMSVVADLPTGGDISDFIEATPTEERQSAIAELLANAIPFIQEEKEVPENKNKQEGKISQSEQLLILLEAMGIEFFHDEIKELYVGVPVDGHMEVRPINSQTFEIWLNGLFYKEVGKPISKDAVKQALAVISAKALYDNPEPVNLSVRVAVHEEAFWYDLTNSDWQSIKITQDGWEVVNNPPIIFTRYRHQKRQITPTSGGDINKILDYVNIKGNETLFLCWLVSCFVPNIPHAMPVIYGEKGAAKSTTSSLLKSLIDPSALDTLTLQNDQRSLAVNLLQHWFLPFDNVSYISEEISDTLCRAITGGSILQRKLHTNFDKAILTFQRCLAINGINNVATRSDLLDRAILIELVRIADKNRRELAEIQANFEADKPSILGGIFDTLSKAMSIYPTVKLQCLPRMADFAKWGYAIGEALSVGLGQVFTGAIEHCKTRKLSTATLF